MTVKQVCRVLAALCREWLYERLALGLVERLVRVVAYYQKRNAAARQAHKAGFKTPKTFILDDDKMDLSGLLVPCVAL